MTYLWVKWLHILSSTLLFGTGLGIAFFMWSAHLRRDARVIAATARTVVIADACFTAPAVLIQLGSGLWLTHLMGLPLTQRWLAWALLLLFVGIGACWLPVLWLQIRARDLATRGRARRTLAAGIFPRNALVVLARLARLPRRARDLLADGDEAAVTRR